MSLVLHSLAKVTLNAHGEQPSGFIVNAFFGVNDLGCKILRRGKSSIICLSSAVFFLSNEEITDFSYVS